MFFCKPESKKEQLANQPIVGNVKIVLRGGSFQDCAAIFKMSPQIKFTVGQTVKSSSIKRSGGKYPVWNDKNIFVFQVPLSVKGAKVQAIHNRQVMSNVDIGFGYIDFERYLQGGLYKGQTTKILKDFKENGTVHFDIEYFPRNNIVKQTMPMSTPISYNQQQQVYVNNPQQQHQRMHQTISYQVNQQPQNNIYQQRQNQSLQSNNQFYVQQQYQYPQQQQHQINNNINISQNASPFFQQNNNFVNLSQQQNQNQLTDEQIQQQISQRQNNQPQQIQQNSAQNNSNQENYDYPLEN